MTDKKKPATPPPMNWHLLANAPGPSKPPSKQDTAVKK